jgi:4'-phosphopantetheinyl transferase
MRGHLLDRVQGAAPPWRPERDDRQSAMTGYQLLEDELHVWHAMLDLDPAVVERLYSLLCADERERAARFRFERDRGRYIVGRGLLRKLLGRYLALEPEQLSFEYSSYQKPRLAQPGPRFNISHSGPVALFAFTNIAEVGIDVELDNADFAQERIAERFFSPAEVAALRSLPPQLQARAFLTCWTRKEAFVKARGDGLALALDRFDVSLRPGHPAALVRTEWSGDEPRHWTLIDLSDSDAGYVAAVALRAERPRVISSRFTFNTGEQT